MKKQKKNEKHLEGSDIYCEDPRFYGKMKILDAKRCKEKGTYTLKIKFEIEKED